MKNTHHFRGHGKRFRRSVNDSVEAIFTDALAFFSSDVEDNKKHKMYLQIQNVFLEVEKGGHNQEVIEKLAARAVT